MAGLLGRASGTHKEANQMLADARKGWEKSMARRLNSLREGLRSTSPQIVSDRSGAMLDGQTLQLPYWGQKICISWPELEARVEGREVCSTFDTTMLLYYMTTADGSPLEDRWISFRELPGGAFYNQAFQGYSGDKIARAFAENPDALSHAALSLGGWKLPALADHAYAFQPLPRIRLAAVLWLGDEDFPSRCSVLFDASSPHYMITDGLALLGSGVAGRLIKAKHE